MLKLNLGFVSITASGVILDKGVSVVVQGPAGLQGKIFTHGGHAVATISREKSQWSWALKMKSSRGQDAIENRGREKQGTRADLSGRWA